MRLQITRALYLPEAAIGSLAVDGGTFCQISEPLAWAPGLGKDMARPTIPAGVYEVVVTYAPRFRQPLPLLLNVAGHQEVRICSAPPATGAGPCLGVGWYDAISQKWVHSAPLHAALLDLIQAARNADQPVELAIV